MSSEVRSKGPASSSPSSRLILCFKVSFCLESFSLPSQLAKALSAARARQALEALLLACSRCPCSSKCPFKTRSTSSSLSKCSSSRSRKQAFSQALLTRLLAKILRYRIGKLNKASRSNKLDSLSSSTNSSVISGRCLSTSLNSRCHSSSLNSRCSSALVRSSDKRLTPMCSRCLWVVSRRPPWSLLPAIPSFAQAAKLCSTSSL